MEESRGEGVLDRSVVNQQHRVRRTIRPAQHGFECVSSNKKSGGFPEALPRDLPLQEGL